MGEEDKKATETEVEPEKAEAKAEAPEAKPAPGTIPEPRERSWSEEAADPFDGVKKADPFEGRPQSEVPHPPENIDDAPRRDAKAEPGQPLLGRILGKKKKQDSSDENS